MSNVKINDVRLIIKTKLIFSFTLTWMELKIGDPDSYRDGIWLPEMAVSMTYQEINNLISNSFKPKTRYPWPKF